MKLKISDGVSRFDMVGDFCKIGGELAMGDANQFLGRFSSPNRRMFCQRAQ